MGERNNAKGIGLPHLTLSFGRENTGVSTSGNLSELCLGLACFVAWALSGGIGMPTLIGNAAASGGGVGVALSFAMHVSFGMAAFATMLFIGCTDQRHLRFYVGKNVLALAGGFGVVGTACAALGVMGGMPAWVLGCGGAALSGVSAGILFPLWGTAFARDEFTTITLNSAAAVAIGIVLSVLLVEWAPFPASIAFEVLLVCLSALLLLRTTPIPYYRRRAMPVFHALRVSRVRFLVHLGIPVVLFGMTLGVLEAMCVMGAFCTGIIANDLLVGASCALCLIIFIVDVALMKDEAHWDTLFRYMLPAVGLGLIGIPLFCGAYQLGAVFLLTAGLAILVVLLWVMLSDMCQEFRLSPLFVFGIGGALLVAGVLAGTLLVPPTIEWQTMSPVRWTGLAMGATVLLMLAGSINPRKRDVVKMLAEKHPVVEMTQINQMMVDEAAKRGETLTAEQRDAAVPRSMPESGPEHAGGMGAGGVGAGGSGSACANADASTKRAAANAARDADAPVSADRAAAAAAFAENARLIMGTMTPQTRSEENRTSAEVLSEDTRMTKASAAPHRDDVLVGADVGTGTAADVARNAAGATPEGAHAGADTASGAGTPDAFEPKQKGSFYRRCEEIADQYLLSRRETEVFFLLAKGHKAGFIEDKLCVSRSTAKTHINHIYKKMDIHTQQELLNMVEDRPHLSDAPDTPPLHHGF